MCNPMLASMAATAGGVALQSNNANKAAKQRAMYQKQNSERQRILEEDARAGQTALVEALGRANVTGAMQTGANNMQSQYNSATAAPVARAPMAQLRGAPALVTDTANAVAQQRSAQQAAYNGKLANLNSFADYLNTTIKPKTMDSASNTQMLGGFMQGNNVPLQAELEAANARANSPLAQLLIGGGQVGMGYNLKKPA